MNKILLLPALIAGMWLSADAESKFYAFDNLGEVNGVADNGRYAAVTDPDFGTAYRWSIDNPESLLEISAAPGDAGLPQGEVPTGTTAMDVSDDGVVVGSILFTDYYMPAYHKDGQWHLLPIDANAKGSNEAVCITPDGSVIAGYQLIKDPTADQGGRYYPCQWFRKEDGSYSLKTYTNIELPDHQGFFPMTQTPDGKVIGGTVYCGFGSRVNALIKDEKMIIFDEIETRYEPFMHAGKYYAGKDEDGNQIWVKDINDPRVVLFPEVYINGYKDSLNTDALLEGVFTNCDANGNLYGCRNRVENVGEDGDGNPYSDACIYNYITGDWYTEEGFSFFSAGIGDKLLFTGDGWVIRGSEVTKVAEEYDIHSDYFIQGINKISADGTVLGGVAAELNPAIGGQLMYYPFVVVTDKGVSVQGIAGNPSEGIVLAGPGRIEVLNAGNVAVYDLEGRLVSTDKVTYVSPGIYVVKAGDASYKVNVRR